MKRTESRPCALEDCEERLGSTYRSHAVYCSAACRAEAARRRGTTRKRTEAHSGAGSRRKRDSETAPQRRSSRDGRGVKVYLLPADLDDLLNIRSQLSLMVLRKLEIAQQRLEAK